MISGILDVVVVIALLVVIVKVVPVWERVAAVVKGIAVPTKRDDDAE